MSERTASAIRPREADLLVLGAGPAGAGAAYRAARSGRGVAVVERASGPGGAARSLTVGGQSVDLGSHRLHPSIRPAILEELRALLGDELQLRPRRGRIRIAGRWVGFPLKPADAARNLPPSFLAGAVRDAAARPFRREREDTFAGVLRAGLGPAICDAFYFPYARKVWGVDPERLSAEQARRRVGARSPARMAARVLGRKGSRFWYPAGGYGRISEALASAAAAEGADFRYGRTVERLTVRAGGVVAALDDGSEVAAARAWSTIPLTALAGLCDPSPPSRVLDAARSLRFRAMVLVYLVVARDRYTEFDAHYLPEEWTPVTRFSEPKNYRDGADPPGRTVLCFEIPCDPGSRTWTATDEDLASLALAALSDSDLPVPDVSEVVTHRLSHAYPVYERGFEGPLDELHAWIDAQARLLTFGRQGLFVHDNAHHALAMAWDAAGCLEPGGGFNEARWLRARESFAEHVVED
ncbi:MAG TPA: FAD-dependent oxidoreductase [Actinomycetota bacterium]|nr:FAD-dependent oxidoreductase [Actinomycetota bacterium]